MSPYYLIEIVDGWPHLLGPYPTGEAQKATAREMGAAGKQVFWLDVWGADVPHVGRVRKSDNPDAKTGVW